VVYTKSDFFHNIVPDFTSPPHIPASTLHSLPPTTLKMPFVSIRPVTCGKYHTGYASPISDQIYKHLKYTPEQYHDIFSHPEKMFSMSLIGRDNLYRILSEIPNWNIDKSQEYFIDFVFDNKMWDHIPSTLPFSTKRWLEIVRNYNLWDQKMHGFVRRWINSQEKRKMEALLLELLTNLDIICDKQSPDRNEFLSHAETFGDIGKEYADIFRREFEKKEKKKLEEMKKTQQKTKYLSYADMCKMASSLNMEIEQKGYTSGPDTHTDLHDVSLGYGSYDCDSDDDTLSPTDDDDEERARQLM